MDNCGSRQTTPGASFVHCGDPGWNADALKSLHLQSTKEEASPAPSPAWEVVASDESNPCMQPNTNAGIETPEMESQPDIPQEEERARRSLQIRRPPQHLIETVSNTLYRFL